MLYDPKWEADTKPDIYALPTLIAWAEKQPASKTYDYWNCRGGCWLGEYLRSFGAYHRNAMADLAERCCWVSHIAAPRPWTYGAALSRARALVLA